MVNYELEIENITKKETEIVKIMNFCLEPESH